MSERTESVVGVQPAPAAVKLEPVPTTATGIDSAPAPPPLPPPPLPPPPTQATTLQAPAPALAPAPEPAPAPEVGGGLQVILPMEDFAEDLDLRLGRANGNIFHRRPGIPGVHDGQVMVRLKKKRFIVIDYSIVPTESDLQVAAMTNHISCPAGAGKAKCTTPECDKIGVPVLLYDSDPSEPASLYMRSGLCFTCQRNLNEKRRTQRKRGNEPAPNLIYAMGPGQKRFRMNGGVINLNSDAIIINGAVDGAKHHGDGYSFHEIAVDLQHAMHTASAETDHLLASLSGGTTVATTIPPPTTTLATETMIKTEPTPDLAAQSAAAAADALLGNHTVPGPPPAPTPETATHPTPEGVTALYEKAFQSMNKAIFLLSQWKASWDSAVSTAVAQETAAAAAAEDQNLADVVASAAAVAAAATAEQPVDQNSTNMVSLLLAADQRKEDEMPAPAPAALVPAGGGVTENDVQAFEV